MRCALDVLFADVPAEQVDEARDFYASRAVGRGPSTPEELKEARARRAVPRAAGPPAVEETIEAAETRVPLRIFPPVEGPPRRSGSSKRPMPASERPGSGNANYTARSLMTEGRPEGMQVNSPFKFFEVFPRPGVCVRWNESPSTIRR